MIRFIVNSFIFKKLILITAAFTILLAGANLLFDHFWSVTSFIMLTNLDNIYKPPVEYDNLTRINLFLTDYNKVQIEGNKKFKLQGSTKQYGYSDTLTLTFPDKEHDYLNKYFFNFESSPYTDSLYIVISKSGEKDYYWKQIFLSSVFVDRVNSTNEDSEFKVENKNLLNNNILENNDSLIQQVYDYFNTNKDNLGLKECGTNCNVFKSICGKFNVPCRIVTLQGGDALNDGYNTSLGYPLHAICEIYSSRLKKWFVVDPSYGVIYTEDNKPENAIEISDKVYFDNLDKISQDSILVTKTSLLDRDYFKYYENIYYRTTYKSLPIKDRLLRYFYGKFEPKFYQYSNTVHEIKNGYYYVGLKTVLYLLIIVAHFNSVMFLVLRRLMSVKKPIKYNYDRKYINTA